MNENQYGRVSVIIPARNEELNIARVVRSLAKQSGIREILVVNDQSTDRTGEILAALEAEIPLLRTLRVESLPEGWLGKTHAVAQAARAATGDWLLFTDADTEHLAGSLANFCNGRRMSTPICFLFRQARRRRHGGRNPSSPWCT